MLEIRNASLDDLDTLVQMEQACFPEEQAATREQLEDRLNIYPNHFWLLERDGEIVSMVNGMVSNQPGLSDELYEEASLHQEDGSWQMLFGVETRPEFRGRGYATLLLKKVIRDCIDDSRRGIILNCRDERIPFYENLGFVHQGKAPSVHGGVNWNCMVLNLEDEL